VEAAAGAWYNRDLACSHPCGLSWRSSWPSPIAT
jgi:hypothetical protein